MRFSHILILSVATCAMGNVITTPFQQIIIYGNSFADTHNVYELSKKLYPPYPYYKGRFSNGPMWVDALSEKLTIKIQNNAYGGAISDNKDAPLDPINLVRPGFVQQIEDIKVNTTVPTLYITEIGANDIFALASSGKITDAKYANTKMEEITQNVITGLDLIKQLHSGQDVMMLRMPALDKFPQIPKKVKAATKKFVLDYNDLLERKLSKISDLRIFIFDLYAWLDNEMANASRLNITDVQNPCIKHLVIPCKDPEAHFFWDTAHFTTQVHRSFGNTMLQVLKDQYNIA
ncbi:SGNH hydrolase-type esterase domain-containing protein [Blakeslea trispora]|nr:SGNH hydrolase-type esterase domain-containing protein [Blakeslea trispora]